MCSIETHFLSYKPKGLGLAPTASDLAAGWDVSAVMSV